MWCGQEFFGVVAFRKVCSIGGKLLKDPVDLGAGKKAKHPISQTEAKTKPQSSILVQCSITVTYDLETVRLCYKSKQIFYPYSKCFLHVMMNTLLFLQTEVVFPKYVITIPLRILVLLYSPSQNVFKFFVERYQKPCKLEYRQLRDRISPQPILYENRR